MLTKQELLQEVTAQANQSAITKEELILAYDQGAGIATNSTIATPGFKKLGVAEILYYIGGAIVFLGIAIFLSQNWSTLSFFTKLLATLGVGIATYIAGLLLIKNKNTETVSYAFFLIAALATPIGLGVIFNKLNFIASASGAQSVMAAIMFGMYFAGYALFKKNVFMLFSILFGTWLFFAFTNFLVGTVPYANYYHFYEYRVLVVGLTYMLLGYAFSKNDNAPLSGFLYGFGVLGFLGAALALGGWTPRQNILWELIYPALVFGALFISVHIKSKAFLTWGTLFLMAYIIKITAEYFSSGLGWPLALVIAGLAMIGVGYMSFTIKKKYIGN